MKLNVLCIAEKSGTNLLFQIFKGSNLSYKFLALQSNVIVNRSKTIKLVIRFLNDQYIPKRTLIFVGKPQQDRPSNQRAN